MSPVPPCIPLNEVEDGLDNDCDGEIDNGISADSATGVPVAIPCVILSDLADFDPNEDDVLTRAELGALAEQFPDNTSLRDLVGSLDERGIAGIQYQRCIPADPGTPCIDQPGMALLDPNKDDVLTIEELQEIAAQFPDNPSLQDVVAQAEEAGLDGLQYQGCESVLATPETDSVTVPTGPCQDAVESAQAGEGPYAEHELILVTFGEKGGPGAEVIIGSTGADIIDAVSGNDIVCGLGGNDVIAGGPDGARLYGNDGDDTLLGGAGDDVLDGGGGANTCDGASGSNEVTNCEG